MKRLLAILLLLPLPAWAVNITDCGVLNTPNTTYVLQNDVTADGSCFSIIGSNISLDLNGHTVTYDNRTPPTVVNGSFELADSSWDLSGASNTVRAAGTFVKPVSVYTGSYALKVATPCADQTVVSTSTVDLLANTNYFIAFQLNNPISDNITASVELTGTSYKASWKKITSGFYFAGASFKTTDAGSYTITINVTGAGSVPSGFIYIDDIKVISFKEFGVAVGPYVGTTFPNQSTYGNASNATIYNGTIVQGAGGGERGYGVMVGENSSTGLHIHDVIFNNNGPNSKAIYTIRGNNIRINANQFYSSMYSVSNRNQFDGATVKVEYPTVNGGSIDYNIIYTGVQSAIYARSDITAGATPIEIHHNDITLQTRFTNDFAILSNGKVYNNTINCGTGNNSCRGIGVGTPGAQIYNNVVTVQELARNQEYNGCEMSGAYGIQMEGTINAVVYSNTITAIAGECDAIAFRANPCSFDTGSPVWGSNNEVYGNTFRAIKNGTGYASAMKFSEMKFDAMNLHDNTLKTNSEWVYHEHNLANNLYTYGLLLRDTTFITDGAVSSRPLTSYWYKGNPSDVWYVGNIYSDETAETSITNATIMNRTSGVIDPLASFSVGWRTNVTVTTDGVTPVLGATITFTDKAGNVAATGTSDASGIYSVDLREWRNVAGAKVQYSPYTMTVSSAQGYSSIPVTVTANQNLVVSLGGDGIAPITTASSTGTNPIIVTLTRNEAGTTYYTLDGSDPTSSLSRQIYTGPINISQTTTIRFFSIDTSGNQEEVVRSASFTIVQVTPAHPAPQYGRINASFTGTFKSP